MISMQYDICTVINFEKKKVCLCNKLASRPIRWHMPNSKERFLRMYFRSEVYFYAFVMHSTPA
jgi:hypothetical protein